LKIYLLDYTPDTIAWLKDEINPALKPLIPAQRLRSPKAPGPAGIPPSAASLLPATAPISSTSALK